MSANEFRTALKEADERPVGTIVHIGVGYGAEVGAYRDAHPANIVLVDARAEIVESLRLREDDAIPTRILHAAIGATEGPVPFHVLAFGDLSSLSDANRAAHAEYPGLKALETVTVPGMTLRSLLGSVELSKRCSNTLVVDAPGAEAEIIDDLAGTPAAKAFSLIVIRASRAAFYVNGKPARDLLERMRNQGFELRDSWPSSDPAWLWYGFAPDRVRAAAEAVRAQLHVAEGQVAMMRDVLLGKEP